ncbi:hypothetical protein QLX08_007610 [Tetragonisca angustula]|uniref:Uncharacterized protein n=1 Tax=Tetragonisca angustula TaxID=166442 RepID=A0AAW0ZP47_9HYME
MERSSRCHVRLRTERTDASGTTNPVVNEVHISETSSSSNRSSFVFFDLSAGWKKIRVCWTSKEVDDDGESPRPLIKELTHESFTFTSSLDEDHLGGISNFI